MASLLPAVEAEDQQNGILTPPPPPHQAGLAADDSLAQVPAVRLHSLLLLADSALPLGSFAFSSGLESYLSHRPKRAHDASAFHKFLSLSLASITSTSVPYVAAGYSSPHRLEDLDNDFDASTTCTVARRASVKQGRALIAVWERSFRAHLANNDPGQHGARAAMDAFCTAIKTADESDPFSPNGHLAPLFGVLCAVLCVPLPHVLYVFLMNHAKTLVSAAIRSSVLGPYQAQSILASEALQSRIASLVQDELRHAQVAGVEQVSPKDTRLRTDDAGQSVPMLDLWGGRHEIVYSRIFNS